MILGRSNNIQRKAKHIMLQNTPSKAEIRQQIKFNDRLFLKNQNAGIKDFFKKIGRGAKKIWRKVKKPIKKVWNFITEGPGNKLIQSIPVVGPTVAPVLKTVDDVIDTSTEIVKDVKDNSKTIKENLLNDDKELLQDVDTEKLKKDFDWIKENTKKVYDKVKGKLTPKQKASAIEAAGMLNLNLLRRLTPMQRGRIKKIFPYAPYIDISKFHRVNVPKFIRDIDPNAPKTIDNTGGRLFLRGYSSGINLNDNDLSESGRVSLSAGSSGRIALASGNISLTEPQSGACTNKSSSKSSGKMSKEEIYRKLFG